MCFYALQTQTFVVNSADLNVTKESKKKQCIYEFMVVMEQHNSNIISRWFQVQIKNFFYNKNNAFFINSSEYRLH